MAASHVSWLLGLWAAAGMRWQKACVRTLLSPFFTIKSVDMIQCHAPPHSLSLPVEERSSSCTPSPSSLPPGVLKELPAIF